MPRSRATKAAPASPAGRPPAPAAAPKTPTVPEGPRGPAGEGSGGRRERTTPDRETRERLAEFALLATGLAHEIRNRLNTIRFNVLNLQDGLARPKAAGAPNGALAPLVQGIGDEVGRLEGTLREFLCLARPEPSHLEAVQVGELLHRVARLAEGPCRSQNVELSWACPPAVPAAADPRHLEQVLLSLVQNARQAMPQGGRICLRGYLGPEHAVLEVADTGPGIPEEVRARVLQPFFSTRRGGMGLGLSICQRLVEQMNGRLEFQTEVGRGTTFVVRLPRAPGEHV
jgi:signal transduction histidine kinase